MLEEANWMEYPRDTGNDEEMREKSISSILGNNSPQQDISIIVVASTHVTPLSILSGKGNKRDFPEAMDVDEEETSRMPKKLKTENTGKLIQTATNNGKRKIVKVKGPCF